jgi:hypothetical protein
LESSPSRTDLTDQSKRKSGGELESSSSSSALGVVSWRRSVHQEDRKMVYIKELNSSPIDIKLTLITRAKLDLKGDTSQQAFQMKEKLMHFGMSLINTENASLQINALKLTNVFGCQKDILALMAGHYN